MKNNKSWILILSLVFLVVAVFTKGFGFLGESKYRLSSGDGGVITIPVSEVSENAKWFEYNEGRFFVVKANNGTIKTALNACDVCYAAGKGYRQEGDDMVCNNCGLRFAIKGLGTENKNPGGCWPSYLSSAVERDNIVIKKADL